MMGGDGAQGEGGLNMMGEGELKRGCILGGLYGLNRFGLGLLLWPDISISGRFNFSFKLALLHTTRLK